MKKLLNYFERIGLIIKWSSLCFSVLGFLCAVGTMIYLILNSQVLLGVLLFFAIDIVADIFALFICAFGDLVNNTYLIKEKLYYGKSEKQGNIENI